MATESNKDGGNRQQQQQSFCFFQEKKQPAYSGNMNDRQMNKSTSFGKDNLNLDLNQPMKIKKIKQKSYAV